MLFDPRPKVRKEELYDREEELEKLLNTDAPIILLLAPRRLGKTSLLNVFANQLEGRCLIIDCREVFHEQNYSSKNFLDYFTKLVNQNLRKNPFLRGIRKVKSSIKNLKIYGLELGFDKEPAKKFVEILFDLDKRAEATGKNFILAFDEAQMLRFLKRPGGLDFPLLLSFAYDRFRHLQFVLTGSEVGILRDFLSFDDPSSPLYGRSVLEIALPRFTQEQSIDFLKKGFSEIGMMVSDGLIERAISKLDGIVGWLTAFGYRCYVQQTANEEVLESVLSQARQMIYEEIQEIIRYSENFKYILKALAQGASTWKSIKEGAEFFSRKRMTDTSFNRLLMNLVRMGYVEKVPPNGYKLIDPIVADVATTL